MAVFTLAFMTAAASRATTTNDQHIRLIPGAFPTDKSPDGNTIVFEDVNSLIVVDTGRHPEHQAAILDYAHSTGKPIVAIVNTHWHLDHSGGNRVVRRSYPRAALYSSDAIRGALRGFLSNSFEQYRTLLADPRVSDSQKADIGLDVEAISDATDLVPDHPVSDTMSLPFRGGVLELHLAPHAATDGDVWVYEPVTRTLAAGDLVVIPVPFFDTACAAGWRRALDRLDAVPFSRLYPGHGPALSKAQFETYRRAFGHLVDCADSASAKGDCIDGWMRDAESLMASEQERRQARAYLDYYIDNVIRKPGRQDELCGRRSDVH